MTKAFKKILCMLLMLPIILVTLSVLPALIYLVVEHDSGMAAAGLFVLAICAGVWGANMYEDIT